MDTLTIIIGTLALAGLVGMAFLGGYQLGEATGTDNERALCNTRINGILAGERRIGAVIDYENKRKPKAAKNRRKAQRKAVRA